LALRRVAGAETNHSTSEGRRRMTSISTRAQAEADEIVTTLLTDPPQNPYPYYARLRELDPIHRASVGDFWTLTRYDDIATAVRDKRFTRDFDTFRRHNGRSGHKTRPFDQHQPNWFIFSNPPEYVQKRGMYGQAFTRENVDTLRDFMSDAVNELLDKAAAKGRMEVVADLSFGLTSRVIAHALGVPQDNMELLVEYAEALGPTFDPLVTEPMLQRIDDAVVKLESFLEAFIAEKRRNLGPDLLSRLIEAHAQKVITDEELLANVGVVFTAGLDTTTYFIGNCVYSLLKNPDQWQLFLTDPDGLVAGAVEELLRYESSIQADPPLRLAGEDIEIAGVTIPRGEAIVPLHGAANRDPARYVDPDRLDITRKDIRVLSFGGGIHICLGQFLARAEAQVALALLAKRFPDMHLVGEEPTWRPGVTSRTLNALHVGLG
jgi:cytochrome P450